MDLFFDVLPMKDKKRLHFHHFMKDIHERLSGVKQTKNPLSVIAKNLSDEFSVLCLDEFMVHDIGDAMILSELLAAMTQHGITLLTTSNTAPENLYLDGLQRTQFLKTISLLNQYCHVLHVDGGIDYREHDKDVNTVYFWPNSKCSMKSIHQWFANNYYAELKTHSITLQSRQLNVLYRYEEAIWFEFDIICKTNRSRSDYIELTERFKVVALSGLHVMDDQANDVIRRFITLVDVVYDNNITLIISADVNIEALYEGEFLKFEFRRTMSRLYEMQSKHYLKR
jgi:cell division protein ZapE